MAQLTRPIVPPNHNFFVARRLVGKVRVANGLYAVNDARADVQKLRSSKFFAHFLARVVQLVFRHNVGEVQCPHVAARAAGDPEDPVDIGDADGHNVGGGAQAKEAQELDVEGGVAVANVPERDEAVGVRAQEAGGIAAVEGKSVRGAIDAAGDNVAGGADGAEKLDRALLAGGGEHGVLIAKVGPGEAVKVVLMGIAVAGLDDAARGGGEVDSVAATRS